MNIHNVHWEAWQAVRPLRDGDNCDVFEIQHFGPGGVEKAALKVLHIPSDPNTVPRFLSQGMSMDAVKERLHSRMEAAAKAYSLMYALREHPNVLSCDEPIYDPMADGFGWELKVKSELLQSLSQAWPQGMPEEQVLRLGTDLATALALCQEGGLVHEGVKASNVFVRPDGSFCLGDFGAAKATGMPCGGDRSCMSPEIYWGMEYDASTDVYALGVLMYTMLNGGYMPLTYPGLTPEQMEQANVNRLSGQSLPAPCSGSAPLQQLVLRACAYEPGQRIRSASELRAELLKLQGMDAAAPLWPERASIPEALPEQAPTVQPAPQPQQAPEAEAVAPAPKPRKNNSMLYLILAVAAAVLVAGVVCFFTIHSWPEVSCNETAKCKICGMTSTKVTGHKWQEATCVKPATCSRCGETQGEALGHQLTAATRLSPATCTVCGVTEGDVLQPTVWVMKVISAGWQGGHQQSVEGTTVLLSFPRDPSFVGSGVLAVDAYGNIAINGFTVEWDKETAKVTPTEDLKYGVYQLQFSAGDSGAMINLCYGYAEEYYLCEQEYFWSAEVWSNATHGLYLVVNDSGVSASEQPSRGTTFDSPYDMVGVEKSGGKLMPTAGACVPLQCLRFAKGGQEGYTAFTYEGQFLACDDKGTVYFSEALDENCLWVQGR